MFKKFQTLIDTVMENVNAAGAGGVFGSPQAGAEITNPTSINPAGGYSSDIKTSMAVAQPNKRAKKKKTPKSKFPIIRRNLPKKDL
jgi:hypothetical protein